MNFNFLKYLMFFLFFISCKEQKIEVKNYGFFSSTKEQLTVPIELAKFSNYGMFIDRIREITCNDSIPIIYFEKENVIRNIYPSEYCDPPIFDPDGKHYVTFRKGKVYEWESNEVILTDSIHQKLIEDFSYQRNSNSPKLFLVIVESDRKEKMDGLENFCNVLMEEHDNLKTDLALSVSFWPTVPPLPPIPENQ